MFFGHYMAWIAAALLLAALIKVQPDLAVTDVPPESDIGEPGTVTANPACWRSSHLDGPESSVLSLPAGRPPTRRSIAPAWHSKVSFRIFRVPP